MISGVCIEIYIAICSQLLKQIFFACEMISEAYSHLKGYRHCSFYKDNFEHASGYTKGRPHPLRNQFEKGHGE